MFILLDSLPQANCIFILLLSLVIFPLDICLSFQIEVQVLTSKEPWSILPGLKELSILTVTEIIDYAAHFYMVNPTESDCDYWKLPEEIILSMSIIL